MGQIESEGIVSLKKDLNALLLILSSITIILVFYSDLLSSSGFLRSKTSDTAGQKNLLI